MDELQSWWEVPSIAHFCSLFRVAFNLFDFEIEELEEAFLASGSLDGSPLLTDLLAALLAGCYGRKEIKAEDVPKYLYDILRARWVPEKQTEHPIDKEVGFHVLPLRTKVEIVHAVCDYRLDAEDVAEQLKGLEGDNLRLEPLGKDANGALYWYFFGSRLYKEIPPPKPKLEDKSRKHNKKRKSEKDEEFKLEKTPSSSSKKKKKKKKKKTKTISQKPVDVSVEGTRRSARVREKVLNDPVKFGDESGDTSEDSGLEGSEDEAQGYQPASHQPASQPSARGRGRPKTKVESDSDPDQKPKPRGRGRPRTKVESESDSERKTKVRGRGRPRTKLEFDSDSESLNASRSLKRNVSAKKNFIIEDSDDESVTRSSRRARASRRLVYRSDSKDSRASNDALVRESSRTSSRSSVLRNRRNRSLSKDSRKDETDSLASNTPSKTSRRGGKKRRSDLKDSQLPTKCAPEENGYSLGMIAGDVEDHANDRTLQNTVKDVQEVDTTDRNDDENGEDVKMVDNGANVFKEDYSKNALDTDLENDRKSVDNSTKPESSAAMSSDAEMTTENGGMVAENVRVKADAGAVKTEICDENSEDIETTAENSDAKELERVLETAPENLVEMIDETGTVPEASVVSMEGRAEASVGADKGVANAEVKIEQKDATPWSLCCSTVAQWQALADSFKESVVKCEKDLHKTLMEDFLPEIPRLIEEKEKLMRKRLLEMAPRRLSSRLEKKLAEVKGKRDSWLQQLNAEQLDTALKEESNQRLRRQLQRELEEKRRQEAIEFEKKMEEERIKAKEERAQRLQMREERAQLIREGKFVPPELSAPSSTRKRYKFDDMITSGIPMNDDTYTALTRIMEKLVEHHDAWLFRDPVDEEYAPGYYEVIDEPMDLSKMRKKLRSRDYNDPAEFAQDFRLIVDNCIKFNGFDSECSSMVGKLEKCFHQALSKFLPELFVERSELVDKDFFRDSDVTSGRPRRAATQRAIEKLQKVTSGNYMKFEDSPFVSTKRRSNVIDLTEATEDRKIIDLTQSDDSNGSSAPSPGKSRVVGISDSLKTRLLNQYMRAKFEREGKPVPAVFSTDLAHRFKPYTSVNLNNSQASTSPITHVGGVPQTGRGPSVNGCPITSGASQDDECIDPSAASAVAMAPASMYPKHVQTAMEERKNLSRVDDSKTDATAKPSTAGAANVANAAAKPLDNRKRYTIQTPYGSTITLNKPQRASLPATTPPPTPPAPTPPALTSSPAQHSIRLSKEQLYTLLQQSPALQKQLQDNQTQGKPLVISNQQIFETIQSQLGAVMTLSTKGAQSPQRPLAAANFLMKTNVGSPPSTAGGVSASSTMTLMAAVNDTTTAEQLQQQQQHELFGAVAGQKIFMAQNQGQIITGQIQNPQQIGLGQGKPSVSVAVSPALLAHKILVANSVHNTSASSQLVTSPATLTQTLVVGNHLGGHVTTGADASPSKALELRPLAPKQRDNFHASLPQQSPCASAPELTRLPAKVNIRFVQSPGGQTRTTIDHIQIGAQPSISHVNAQKDTISQAQMPNTASLPSFVRALDQTIVAGSTGLQLTSNSLANVRVMAYPRSAVHAPASVPQCTQGLLLGQPATAPALVQTKHVAGRPAGAQPTTLLASDNAIRLMTPSNTSFSPAKPSQTTLQAKPNQPMSSGPVRFSSVAAPKPSPAQRIILAPPNIAPQQTMEELTRKILQQAQNPPPQPAVQLNYQTKLTTVREILAHNAGLKAPANVVQTESLTTNSTSIAQSVNEANTHPELRAMLADEEESPVEMPIASVGKTSSPVTATVLATMRETLLSRVAQSGVLSQAGASAPYRGAMFAQKTIIQPTAGSTSPQVYIATTLDGSNHVINDVMMNSGDVGGRYLMSAISSVSGNESDKNSDSPGPPTLTNAFVTQIPVTMHNSALPPLLTPSAEAPNETGNMDDISASSVARQGRKDLFRGSGGYPRLVHHYPMPSSPVSIASASHSQTSASADVQKIAYKRSADGSACNILEKIPRRSSITEDPTDQYLNKAPLSPRDFFTQTTATPSIVSSANSVAVTLPAFRPSYARTLLQPVTVAFHHQHHQHQQQQPMTNEQAVIDAQTLVQTGQNTLQTIHHVMPQTMMQAVQMAPSVAQQPQIMQLVDASGAVTLIQTNPDLQTNCI